MSAGRLDEAFFDMDGTLYQFPSKKKFAETEFGKTIKGNTIAYLGGLLGVDEVDAKLAYNDIKLRWNGEISLGLENELGIPREQFFENTWNLSPERFIIPEVGLRDALGGLATRATILSAAPRVWVNRVLDFLQIADFFEGRIFSGEPDIRKPSPLAFQNVADVIGASPERIVSIGDQEFSDIVPAKALGMRAVRVGGNEPSIADFVVPSVTNAIETVNKGVWYE